MARNPMVQSGPFPTRTTDQHIKLGINRYCMCDFAFVCKLWPCDIILKKKGNKLACFYKSRQCFCPRSAENKKRKAFSNLFFILETIKGLLLARLRVLERS